MGIAIGCITPHPPIIVPEIGRESVGLVEKTIKAMEDLAAKVREAKPDALVIVSPHGAAFADTFAVKSSDRLRGSFDFPGAWDISFDLANDKELAEEIAGFATRLGVPAITLAERLTALTGTEELDHGVLVPFCYIFRQGFEVPIVSVSISGLTREQHYLFGVAVQKASDALGRSIAFVASGDLSHRLTPDAPAGFDEMGKFFDEEVVSLVEKGDLGAFLAIDRGFAERAGECGLRSLMMLAGACDGFSLHTEVLSYEGPFGVGYLVAVVEPLEEDASRSLIREGTSDGDLSVESLNHHVKLARTAVQTFVSTGKVLESPASSPVAELAAGRAGCFVSIKNRVGELRGCIGTLAPTQATLGAEIISNAIQAATSDPRFPAVSENELPYLKYSVDVLEAPERIADERDLEPQTYGIIVKLGYQTGVLLPMLEGVETVAQQVAIAKRKAGIPHDAEAELYRFKVRRYSED